MDEPTAALGPAETAQVRDLVMQLKQEGIGIFEPIGRIGEVAEATLQEMDTFHKAREHYRKQRWVEAEAAPKPYEFGDPFNLDIERTARLAADEVRRFGLTPNTVRLLFVLSCLLPGPQFLAYIVLWILMPKQ